MKVYYHAGLKEVAESCGFRSTTLKSLESYNNFKRIHCFLVQVWEAIYHEMVHIYIYHTYPSGLMANVKSILEAGIKEPRSPYDLMVTYDLIVRSAATHPSQGYIQKTSLFFNYCIKAFKI